MLRRLLNLLTTVSLPRPAGVALMVTVTAATVAGQVPMYGPPGGEGIFLFSPPDELQFTDVRSFHEDEGRYAADLARGGPAERLAAARGLWRGLSRRHAADVLKYAAGPDEGTDEFRAFRRDVHAAVEPKSIVRELEEGNYPWAAWLAFLRPHERLVPVLLRALEDKPQFRPETLLALGASRDARALKPLVQWAESGDYKMSGFAAEALGHFGGPDAEAVLVKLVLAEDTWPCWRACAALAKIGTAKAVPALEKVASGHHPRDYNSRTMAQRALDAIAQRKPQ